VVVAAVQGLGGVGKSTLAAHYAPAQAGCETGRLNPVWWITADSPATLKAGLAALAVALQPEPATVPALEALAEQATSWLAAHDGWLLVLDNVIDSGHGRRRERTSARSALRRAVGISPGRSVGVTGNDRRYEPDPERRTRPGSRP
jgi:hypothetical protein